jgi:hypothetical protein
MTEFRLIFGEIHWDPEVSFSEKLPTTLAATHFHSPQDSFIHKTPVFLHLSEDCCRVKTTSSSGSQN